MSFGRMKKLQYLKGLLQDQSSAGYTNDTTNRQTINTGGGGDPSDVTTGLLGNGVGGSTTKNAALADGAGVDNSAYTGQYQYGNSLPLAYMFMDGNEATMQERYNQAMQKQKQDNILATYNKVLPHQNVNSYDDIPVDMLQYFQADNSGGVSANIDGVLSANSQARVNALRENSNQRAQANVQQAPQQSVLIPERKEEQ